MGKLVINSYDDFEKHVGEILGKSEWQKITQDQINLFADATLDHQWIHTDPERAAKESPFGTTIAHGYLSVSILAYHWDQIVEVNNVKMLVNYGMNNLKFGQPVVVNSEVRVVAKLRSIKNLRGLSKAEIDVTMEIKGGKKDAFEATVIFVYHFDN
ncbi:MAG TPA: MaoC family dehydratase [Bacteroidales bacterium]|nr:MaoC family dehydratase [Bacteroidales bacterium]